MFEHKDDAKRHRYPFLSALNDLRFFFLGIGICYGFYFTILKEKHIGLKNESKEMSTKDKGEGLVGKFVPI